MNTLANRRVLIEDSYNQPESGSAMEFRLTYAGELFATQRDSRPGQPSRHMENKHKIRSVFHRQLRQLWQESPSLNGTAEKRPQALVLGGKDGPPTPLTKAVELAGRHALYGFNFVPLVTQELDLICGLDILFLRPDKPGSVVWAGDMNNRLKTLLDALRIPEAAENYSQRSPGADELPFFCLLEDDKLITKVVVD